MINRKHYPVLLILLCIAGISTLHLLRKPSFSKKSFLIDTGQPEQEEGGKRRAEYEWKLLRNPKTGKIPEAIRHQELEWVKTVPFKNENLQGPSVANTYIPVGPSQNGGRTRSLAFDVRYNGTSNRVMLAGGVNGGIFRSTDGGQTWVFVHPVNEIRAVSCFAQDPRPGFQDTWYAGTGEAVGASAAYPNAFVYGNGIFKSTDNGLTWTILTSTTNGDPFGFDNPFDFVYNLAVNPVNGHVYAAVHRRIIRSTNAGSSWSTVLGSATASTALAGISDIIINKAGSKLYAYISGRNPDRGLAGVWMSSTGDTATWTRIAGGVEGQADSIPTWRAYNNTTVSGDFTAGWGRGILALAPSNQNILYVMYDNAQSESTTEAEADLFRCDMTNPTFVWTNLSANLVAKRNGSTNTFFKIQGGYDMSIAVHPNTPNTILIGGVSLFRSTDGFNTQNNVLFAGGQTSTTFTDPGRNSHVDYHLLAFDPSNANRLITASDGGLEVCDNITASSPVWNLLDGQYQTMQYYHVGIDPTTGSRNYFGGAQDNSTTLRDLTGFLGSILPDSNDHFILIGGDGGQVGMTKKNGSNQQFLFGTAQLGQLYRVQLFASNTITSIKPSNSGEGEFITYFHLDEDNTNFMYFPIEDTLYRTNNSTAVTSTGWTRMDGVHNALNSSIFSMATTRGDYTANSYLFMGTADGKVYRLKDPQGADPATQPTDITPATMPANSILVDIAVNPRNHDTVMAVISNYGVEGVFWTGNATSASPVWQRVQGNISLPSKRSCAIVAKTTGVEYYVGTSVGLFSTTNINGTSTVWAREAGGPMTTAIVNSLAYRWTDNTLLVGTHGNGMFAAYIGNAINIPTGINDPIRNDKNFIKTAFPAITNDNISYQVGNMFTVKRLSVQVNNMAGQLMYSKETGYQNGNVDVKKLAAGMYILTITSNDRKYQFIRKFIKS